MIKLCSIILIVIALLIPNNVSAVEDVQIQEFYAIGGSGDPDWIVIYNESNSTKSIEGWFIRDKTETNKIELTGAICAQSYRKFEFSNRLDKSGDKIKLINSAESQVDEIEYFSSSIPQHQENQSTNKNTQDDTWTVNTAPFPQDNTSCNPQSPSPSPSPTPESNPFPSTKATTSKSPTPKATPKSATKKSPSPTPKVLSTQVGSPSAQSAEQGGIENSISKVDPNQFNPPSSESSTQTTTNKFAALLVGSGAVMIGISTAGFLWYKRQEGHNSIQKERQRFEEDQE